MTETPNPYDAPRAVLVETDLAPLRMPPTMMAALATTDEYSEEAIELARQELIGRGIQDARFDTPPGRSPPPIPGAKPFDTLPLVLKVLCVLLPGIVIFLAAGYLMADRKKAAGEALFFMMIGWFFWLLLFKALGN